MPAGRTHKATTLTRTGKRRQETWSERIAPWTIQRLEMTGTPWTVIHDTGIESPDWFTTRSRAHEWIESGAAERWLKSN